MIRVLGVYRESEFSPGKLEADAAILDEALAEMHRQGAEVRALSPAEFVAGVRFNAQSRIDVVLAMCQSQPALEPLGWAEARGVTVVNSPSAIRNCYRDRLGARLSAAGVPAPAGILLATASAPQTPQLGGLMLERGIFVKRGDLHALFADDVRRVASRVELEAALAGLRARGVGLAYLQQQAEGVVVKFYGVSGSFFRLASDGPQLELELEARLRGLAESAARALGLEVWGGDAVIDGAHINLIDFNDWPSFASVRATAAAAIAGRALELCRESKPRP